MSGHYTEVTVERGDPVVPRGALIAAAVLIAFAIGCAALGRLTGQGAASTEPAPSRIVTQRMLRFDDQADRTVRVTDATTGAVVTTLTADTSGFVRTSARLMARERLRAGEGPGQPFVLTRWADGRLTLDDPATGEHLELESFGSSSMASYARLLTGETP